MGMTLGVSGEDPLVLVLLPLFPIPSGPWLSQPFKLKWRLVLQIKTLSSLVSILLHPSYCLSPLLSPKLFFSCPPSLSHSFNPPTFSYSPTHYELKLESIHLSTSTTFPVSIPVPLIKSHLEYTYDYFDPTVLSLSASQLQKESPYNFRRSYYRPQPFYSSEPFDSLGPSLDLYRLSMLFCTISVILTSHG